MASMRQHDYKEMTCQLRERKEHMFLIESAREGNHDRDVTTIRDVGKAMVKYH